MYSAKLPRFAGRRHEMALAGSGLCVIAMIVGLIGWAVIQARDYAERTADVVTANLAKTLADHFTDTVEKADLGLQAILGEIARQQSTGRFDEGALLAMMARQDGLHPELVGFRIWGADGNLRYALKNVARHRSSIAGQEDFRRLRDHSGLGLVLSPPVFGEVVQKWVIRIGRRIDNRDGSFGGVVYAAIAADHFAETFGALNLGRGGTVTFYHDSGRLAARFPALAGQHVPPDTTAVPPPLRRLMAGGDAEAHCHYTSPIDGVARTATLRRIAGMPYVILVALAESDVLAQWRHDSRVAGLFGAALVVLVLAAMAVLHRRMVAWRQAIDRLAASEERYRGLVQSQNDLVIRFDPQGRLLFVNDAFAKAMGRSSEEMQGEFWQPLVHPEDLTATLQAITLATNSPDYRATVENRVGLPSGWRWVAWEGCSIRNADGETAEFQAVGRDTTDWVEQRRRLTETVRELDASNKDLEQFAYVASHDLREPLRMVTMYVDLLARRYGDKLDSDAREFIGYARDGALRMNTLILDLLDYARIGRVGGREAVELGRAALHAVDVLALAICETHGEVTVGDTLPRVHGNFEDLVRLFQNLIANALKYRSPDRPPRVRVTAVHEGDDMVVRVADNGIGIAPEYRERIFGVFQRLHGPGTYEGTGIGLASAKKIVEQHGGRIWVESTLGEGSTFCFTLPGQSSG